MKKYVSNFLSATLALLLLAAAAGAATPGASKLDAALAQGPTGNVVHLTWIAPAVGGTPIPGVNYHVSRAPCSAAIASGACPTASEGTFAVIATTTAPAYDDSAVTANANYSYYVTAFCPTGGTCPSNYTKNADSAASNHVGAAIPGDAVPPPTGLTITSISLLHNSQNNTNTFSARWTDKPGSTQWQLIDTKNTVIVSGTAYSRTGAFSASKTFPAHTMNPMTLKVCDARGCAQRSVSPTLVTRRSARLAAFSQG